MVLVIKISRAGAAVFFSALVLASCGSPEDSVEQQASDQALAIDPRPARAPTPGKLQFLQCAACHAVEANAAPKVGPNLHCVVGRQAGSLADFDYSAAFDTSAVQGRVWDRATLLSFMEKPMAVIPNNTMAFGGVAKAQNREAIADYLQHMCQTDAS